MTDSDDIDREGIPDYADDTSDAYDSADRPDLDDSPPALPGEEPQGIDEYGTTPAEQRRGEPLSAKLNREEPDVGVDDFGPDEPVGRLVAPDEGAHEDTEAQSVALDAGEVDEQTAEEAAMHEVPGESVRYHD